MSGANKTATLLNIISIVKFFPIFLFCTFGLWYIDPHALIPSDMPPLKSSASAALLLVFAMSGFEMLSVPAGEVRRPHLEVPSALVMVITSVVCVTLATNVIIISVLDNPASTSIPVADAAAVIFGPAGAIAIGVTALFSAVGHNISSMVVGSRMLYALGSSGDLPNVLGRVSSRWGTPVTAIFITGTLIVIAAGTGSFVALAAISAVTRLVIYASVAAATIRMRHMDETVLPKATFVPPFPKLMPWAAIGACAIIVFGIGIMELLATLVALGAGVGIYKLRFYLLQK